MAGLEYDALSRKLLVIGSLKSSTSQIRIVQVEATTGQVGSVAASEVDLDDEFDFDDDDDSVWEGKMGLWIALMVWGGIAVLCFGAFLWKKRSSQGFSRIS